MISNIITYNGIINFDPENHTKKHSKQSSWKRVAMVMFDDDITNYYRWFIERRYNLKLNPPLRGSHVSFINDSINDIKNGLNTDDENYVDKIWNDLKKKYNNKDITVTFNVDTRSDTEHWWFNVLEENRIELHNIRAELGLGRPYFGLHMTIGIVNPKFKEHSDYIVNLCSTFGNEFN